MAALVGDGHEYCWQTAITALVHLPGAVYVEGWAVYPEKPVAFEHAWLIQAGYIVDPTLWQQEVVYFPGLQFSLEEVKAAFVEQKELPIAHRNGWQQTDGPAVSGEPTYWAAWDRAVRFAEGTKRNRLWHAWRRWLDLLTERARK